MFGIGPSEMLILFLVIIIFIRPEDLPKFLRSAGKFYGELKKMYNEIVGVKNQIIKEISDATTLDSDPKNTSVNTALTEKELNDPPKEPLNQPLPRPPPDPDEPTPSFALAPPPSAFDQAPPPSALDEAPPPPPAPTVTEQPLTEQTEAKEPLN